MADNSYADVLEVAAFMLGGEIAYRKGDTEEAFALLRQAVAQPEATATIRQNLALILGLQGRLAEAEALARQDLPPQTVSANLAYLRSATAPAAAGGAGRSWESVSQPHR